MSLSKVSPKLIAAIVLALFFGVALFIRIYFPYDQVFSAEGIKFTSADAYYHIRQVDALVHNFPHLSTFDPYLIFPGGASAGGFNLFHWLLASLSWIIGLGSPTQNTIDVVSVYLPAVMGALVVIPVYFIGKELFGRWAGILSAGLLAILPGEFLGRSILGFTDYHIAETLLTTTAMLFFILAIKSASQRRLAFSHLKRRDWAAIRKPFIYSLLAGIFLGLYFFTWMGALLFVFIIAVYFVVQFNIDHLRQKSTGYLCFVGCIFFSVALIMSLTIFDSMLYLTSFIIALLIPLVSSSVSWLVVRKKIKPVYYPLALLGLGLVGWGLFYLINPFLLSSMLSAFRVFAPAGTQLTTIEMQPLISSMYGNPFSVAWGNFTTGFFLSFISLGILIYLVIKQGNAEKTLLIVWSLIMLAAILGQRRFGYYFAVNIALLTGYLSLRVLELAGFRELTAKATQVVKGTSSRKARPKGSGFTITVNHAVMALVVLVIFLVVFFWNIQPAVATASQARFAPSDAWCSSLSWLKENSPEPFGDPDYYYHLEEGHKYVSLSTLKTVYPTPSEDPDFYYHLERSYPYPKSAYGVLAWWDYGYWITRIAHRIPNANPSQDPWAVGSVASFFTSQDEKSANEIAQELGSAYIIIDIDTAYVNPITASGKFWAVAAWAGGESTEYFDLYLVPQENNWVLMPFFYPEYYRSLAVRMYSFDGEAVIPESTMVISYQESADEKGNIYKLITGAEQFNSYEEAEAYLSGQESANYRIVSMNPMLSPVPLEALEHYKLIHSSDSMVNLPDGREVPGVKIFEYIE